jgi:cytosine/creatinine deaminase
MMDFLRLPEAVRLRLVNATVPGWLKDAAPDHVRADLAVEGGMIVADDGTGVVVDLRGAMVFPAFVDCHTHLDKGHIWGRTPNPDGTFMGALEAVRGDSGARWTEADLRARIGFSLRSAYAYGTRAIRTHLDTFVPQVDVTWPLFAELRAEWAGRVELQGAALLGCDMVEAGGDFARIADTVAAHGGVLGLFTFPMPDMPARLETFFRMAAERGVMTDFHADETLDPSVNTLKQIAEAAIATGYTGSMLAGHTCSLSVMPEDEALRTLDLCAKAGISMVSLPMCNMYLQDRQRGRTPRNRGVTLVHEMKARGISVSFASDNTRDPFYAYGDMDMVEVMREATRICHLDHADPDWSRAFLSNPAEVCGFDVPSLAPGAPADLVIMRARDWSELFARPQADRVVMRGGRKIDRSLPDYAELDSLME